MCVSLTFPLSAYCVVVVVLVHINHKRGLFADKIRRRRTAPLRSERRKLVEHVQYVGIDVRREEQTLERAAVLLHLLVVLKIRN